MSHTDGRSDRAFPEKVIIRERANGAEDEEVATGGLDPELLYQTVVDALRVVLDEEGLTRKPRILKRFLGGRVIFEDAEGKQVKDVPIEVVFRKITTVREKLRIIEQKINNTEALDAAERSDIQAQLSRAYGALTTFNLLFRDEEDKFKGQGG
jgi:hypothetical protein